MTEVRPQTESELVDYIRSIDAPAPEQLHRRVEDLVAQRSTPRGRRSERGSWLRRPVTAALAGGVALLAVVALAVSGLGGGAPAPTAARASALTLDRATAAAPAENSRDGAQLNAAVDGVAFPYWGERFGWRSTGSRTDQIGGRTVRTVFYGNARGQRVGYAIVSGVAPPAREGSVTWRGQTPFRVTVRDDARVVTWLREGHLCVVAGRGVSAATLLALASWDDETSRA